jgi:MoaA/NifB/PqqE/SkfB family radical SAM enzyme
MTPLGDLARDAIIRRIFASDVEPPQEIFTFIGGITIMPNNICNANCVFCAYQYNEEPKDTMTLELFRRALDSAMDLGHVGTLVLTPVAGEPLADRHLFEKIAYAKQRGVQSVYFTTNGILLRKGDNYKRCIDSDITAIYISSPGLNQEAYQRVYRSQRYDAMLEGLLKLLAYKEERGSTVALHLFLRLDRPLEAALADPDMALIQPYVDRGTIVLGDVRHAFDNWSGHITEADLTGTMSLVSAKEKPVPCDRMVHDLAILPDGKVRVCSCRYYKTNHDELVIGDITEAPLKQIHFGDRHRRLLKDVAAGKWPRVCDSCSLYQPLTLTDEQFRRGGRAVHALEPPPPQAPEAATT